MSAGIVSWGVYLPYWRLERSAIARALGTAPGKGRRSVASYDEDTTTLGVEAARRALAVPGVPVPEELVFSTPDPAYLDKTNATTIHAALGLPQRTGAYDLAGSVRSAAGTMLAASAVGMARPTLAVVSDLRTGLAGGADERDSGDGAAALLFGPDGAVAEIIGTASASEEFLERWRVPGDDESHMWEERFGEEVYVPLAQAAFADALKAAGIGTDSIDHLVLAGLHARALRVVKPTLGVVPEAIAADFAAQVGNLGAAQLAVGLADVLERAEPGQVVVAVLLADGADVVVLRTTDALAAAQAARRPAGLATVAEQLGEGRADLSYANFLTWRGQLHREPPRRPDPDRPGAPNMRRSELWKYGFNASRCLNCGFRHLPPARVCLRCQAIDQMEPERLADVEGTIATFTVDYLAFSLSPPIVAAIVDFDGGGRYRCEMTDVDPGTVHIGQRVQMTFRRFYTAQGVHNYFWKARPIEDAAAAT
ncbi:MAG TPA: OB-fold domain-containing protein [Acidimicrobiales bacterium]|nr:OB-fold domain-containing protein [Acidimicrobiales bacterium]